MKIIDFNIPLFGQLRLICTELHRGHDCVFKSNTKNSNLDFLVFFDSRGISLQYENSLADRVVSHLEILGSTYLLICRPVNLTTWASLINFMHVNKINPTKILTNVGFVDFTPKKFSIVSEAIEQVEFVIGKGVAISEFAERYMSSSDAEIDLYFMNYSNEYKTSIETITSNIPTIIINSPYISDNYNSKRPRPKSFYSGLVMTNEFNRSIHSDKLLDIPDFDSSLTYDAVHWTELGSELIFEKVKGYL